MFQLNIISIWIVNLMTERDMEWSPFLFFFLHTNFFVCVLEIFTGVCSLLLNSLLHFTGGLGNIPHCMLQDESCSGSIYFVLERHTSKFSRSLDLKDFRFCTEYILLNILLYFLLIYFLSGKMCIWMEAYVCLVRIWANLFKHHLMLQYSNGVL